MVLLCVPWSETWSVFRASVICLSLHTFRLLGINPFRFESTILLDFVLLGVDAVLKPLAPFGSALVFYGLAAHLPLALVAEEAHNTYWQMTRPFAAAGSRWKAEPVSEAVLTRARSQVILPS